MVLHWIGRFFDPLPWRRFPRALLAVGDAIFRCWGLILFAALGPAILAVSGQGRQALFFTDVALGVVMLFCLGLVIVTVYAGLTLDAAPSPTEPRWARLYARQCVPQLLGVCASFALPLLVRYATSLGLEPLLEVDSGLSARVSLGFLLQFLELCGPLLVFCMPALLTSNSPRPFKSGEIFPLVLIGAVHVFVFLVSDERAVALRLVAPITGILVFNWLCPASFARTPATGHYRLRLMGCVTFIYAVVTLGLAAWLAADPGTRAVRWGPGEVVLIALLAWLCIGFLLDWGLWYLARFRFARRAPRWIGAIRFAVLAAIALRLLTGSFSDAVVNASALPPDDTRPVLSAYLDRWLLERKGLGSKDNPYPVFIVTAEGGGIRAGYWTASVLAALQDRNPVFANHVLAVSGVSGGSMGTSLFAALMDPSLKTAPPACQQSGGYEACARQIAGADLLSAPLVSMLLSEPFHRLTGWFRDSDRAAELDRALEVAWTRVIGTPRFAEPFTALAAGRMLVFPNSTSAGSGRRIVISAVNPEDAFGPTRALDGRAFALSTATLLSARFPGVSPAGLYEESKGNWLRIVDGGFSDNSGAATGADVLNALTKALERSGLGGQFQPVVIAILNGEQAAAAAERGGGIRTLTIGAALDPVFTLNGLREDTSARYQAALQARVTAAGGKYLGPIRLQYDGADLPLGWMLAGPTADTITKRREALDTGDRHFQDVGALLKNAKQ
jgi:predicted acylesterase/phospholipase RssA